MRPSRRFDSETALALAHAACLGAGASEAAARSLARATVAAELRGKANVGFRHLVDYLDAFARGRIARDATPVLTFPAPAMIQCDAAGGLAQLGFDLAFADFFRRAKDLGIAVFSQANSFTTGELGDYVRRLADAGLVGLAATNGPALVAVPGGKGPVYCTNPLAFAAPLAHGPPLVIDQASSATAYVNVRARAERGESLPPGWAVDAQGFDTTDASAAMRGALLTFGGSRGANIALMVEVLAAGLTGANWSLDAPAFTSGAESPAVGLLVMALAPALLDPGFAERLEAQCRRLGERGVYVPGLGAPLEVIELESELVETIEAYSRSP